MLDASPAYASEGNTVTVLLKLTGNSTSDPTLTYGKGVTVTRTAQGVWKFVFSDYEGTFIDYGCNFQATTASGVKGFTASLGDFDATGKIVSLSLWDSTFAAVDLSTTQKACVTFTFRRLGV